MTASTKDEPAGETPSAETGEAWELLASFTLPSVPGGEREGIARVNAALAPLDLPVAALERLGTAVGEATMNAMEHGNKFDAAVPVGIRVEANQNAVRISITDQGDPQPDDLETPDIELKLAGIQSPRGWGLFLIKNMVDDVEVLDDKSGHTVRLIVKRGGNT